MRPAVLELGGPAERVVVFVPGFMSTVGAYRALLEPVAAQGVQVRIVSFAPPGVAALRGRPTPAQEAQALAEQCRELRADGHQVWLSGHSRGGQVAWRTAEVVEPAGLAVVDPVDGAGPRSGPDVTTRAPAFAVAPLVVALGEPGGCAPEPLGPRAFVRCCPQATLVGVADAGHADVTTGATLRLGRRLCGGAGDPQRVRVEVSGLLVDWLG